MTTLAAWLKTSPIIAILRGIRPEEAAAVGDALYSTGIRIMEVPMNSPDPLASIEILSRKFGDRALIGAGTVTDPASVKRICMAGGRMIIMPHGDAEVVQKSKILGLVTVPGFATPTEAFAMIAAGADGLKLFPAGAYNPDILRNLLAVMPTDLPIIPVGGITPEAMPAWRAAGGIGFGVGSMLYKPGMTAEDVRRNAERLMAVA